MFHLQASPGGKELHKSYPSLKTVRINDGTVNNRLRWEFLGFISTGQQFGTRLIWQKTEVLSATNKHQPAEEYRSGVAVILFTEYPRPASLRIDTFCCWFPVNSDDTPAYSHRTVFQATLQSLVTCCAVPWCILTETYTCALCMLPRGWLACQTLVLCPRSEQASWTVGVTTLEKIHTSFT
jgi:hypothetical protein